MDLFTKMMFQDAFIYLFVGISILCLMGLYCHYNVSYSEVKEPDVVELESEITSYFDNKILKLMDILGIPQIDSDKVNFWKLYYSSSQGIPSAAIYFFDYAINRFGYIDYENQTIGTILLSDISSVEVKKEYSYSSITKTNNGIGRAIVGGIVAGEAGAIIGANTANQETISQQNLSRVYLKIHTNDIQHSTYIIGFLEERVAEEFEGIILAIKNKYGN